MSSLKDPDLLRTQTYINGQWINNTQKFAVHNPADSTLIAQVSNTDDKQTEAAIQAAHNALKDWSALTGKERASLMRKWFDLMIQHADDLALLMTLEQGKPLAEARAEVIYGASFIEWFAEEAKRVTGDVLAAPTTDKRMLVLKQPIGVCAAITPWNFPIAMITRKIAPALAAGCTIIVKPAEQTPLSALALAELAHRAQLPPGVLNIIPADADQSIKVGNVLCASHLVRHLSFTGSTEVGRLLMQQCAPTIKKLALELGGHAPFIVFDDADLAQAVKSAVHSKYRNAGQTCVCANRFYVHRSIYQSFVEQFAQASAAIKVGNGLEAGIQQGPLIDQSALTKVKKQVDDATQKGARLVTGGKSHSMGKYFFEPTVLCDTTTDMLIMQEETFGPVAAVSAFDTDEEAITAANNTPYGLAAYFFSTNIKRIWHVAEQLEYGMVGINTSTISNEVAPFGGVKQSGIGREGSRHGIEEYLVMKYLCLGVS